MRGLLIVTLSLFLVSPALGQYVYGEAGLTVPRGSFSYARTGFQAGVTGRLPITESDLEFAGTLRMGFNANPLPQGEIRRLSGVLGTEVSYTQGQLFSKAQIGGGISTARDENWDRTWITRARLAMGIESSTGTQLSIGPTYALTGNDEYWWGLSCAFSF